MAPTGSATSVEGVDTVRSILSNPTLQAVNPKFAPTTGYAQHSFPTVSTPQCREKNHFCKRIHVRSENKPSHLLPYISRRDFRIFRLLERRDTRHKVHLVPSADLRLLDQFVAKVHSEEDGDVDV